MIDEIQEMWNAIVQTGPVAYVVVAIILILAVYMLFVKKDKKFKAIVTKILQDIINDAYQKGIEVEFIVDDIIAKAIKKVKEKPDKLDSLWLYVLNAKWFRNKLISIVKDQIEKIAQAEPDTVLEEVETDTENKIEENKQE